MIFDVITGMFPSQSKPEKDGLKLFPNPVTGILSVSGNFDSEFSVDVFNVAGEKIYSVKSGYSNSNHFYIDCTDFSPGVYFMELLGNKEVKRSMFVKE